jgi:hypothetical protein
VTHGNILNPQLDLPETLLGVVLEVGKRDLKNSALQRVVGVLWNSISVRPKFVLLLQTHSNPEIG